MFRCIDTKIFLRYNTAKDNKRLQNNYTKQKLTCQEVEIMFKIKYYSSKQLLEKAREIMIPMENQIDAQEKIATLLAMHLNKILALSNGATPNQMVSCSAFIVGSTGCGKSYVIKSLAEVCGLPFEQVDCTSIVQAGMRGKNIGDCLLEIIKEKPNFFKYGGVLNLDEADKCFYKNDAHYDCYSPMQDFLKLFEGGEYTFVAKGETHTVNLDKTLILMSGACSNISILLRNKYLPQKAIGFSNTEYLAESNIDFYSLIKIEDLIEYGLMPELASRINTVIHIPNISEEGYKSLIIDKAKTSAINKFKNHFSMRGVVFDISKDAISTIAQTCVERNVGARSIQAILNEHLLYAYNYIDENISYNKVILKTDKMGNVVTKFYKGQRYKIPIFKEENEYDDISLVDELSSEENINKFCGDFCENAYLDDISNEPLVYNFLQTVSRYLSTAVSRHEQNISSILKLAEATERKSTNEDYKSPFDIICFDHLKILEERDNIEYNVFLHYFRNFTIEMKKCNTQIILNAINTAKKYYKFKTSIAYSKY